MTNGGTRLRVTLISKALVVGAYQTKLVEMTRCDPTLELTAIVPPYWREGNQRISLEQAHSEGYRLIVTPMAFNGSYHLHFYPHLARLLAETQPDLCHIDEEPYNWATYHALRAAQRVGAKVIFFTWQNIARRYPWPFSWLEKSVYAGVQGAIAGNRAAAEVLRQKGYRGPIRVIPQFGVDPILFSPPTQGMPDRPFTIGYAGRLEEVKGLGTLAEAIKGLEGPWRLLIVGEGPYRERLRQSLAQAGVGERVTFAGRVPSQKMPAYLHEMDVLVLPSLTRPNWKEQFGRVLIEAMACGVPVVGSDSGEIPHVIGEAGLIFPEGDALLLRRCLERLQQDMAFRQDLARRGRERVLQHYTQAQIAAQTVAFYREVLAP